MTLKLDKISNSSDLDKERIVISVLQDDDVGQYAMLRSYVNNDAPTAGDQEAFWFPDQKVKTGDLVVLYSKDGTTSTKALKNGATVYFFYWGKSNPMWRERTYVPILLDIREWQVLGV
ncbi:hypothetical protein [Magnetovibrio sp.]|uniref:hypothetical protein n=1 Tax=Magnetovibrio sp. TaxID=2024836 RepID=UPI002F92764E